MKQMKKMFVCAFMAASLLSCVKETTQQQQFTDDNPSGQIEINVGDLSFAATAEVTKTTLGSDNVTVSWDANDNIAVFDGTPTVRMFETKEGGAEAVFEGTGNTTATEYYALYPYSSSASMSGGKMSAKVPSVQTGNFNQHIAVAYTTAAEKKLSFKNVTAVVKFTLDEDYVTKVTLKGNNNEIIAGDLAISWNGGNPTVEVSNGATEVSIGDGSTVMAKKDYYFVVAPENLEGGLTLTATIASASPLIKAGTKTINLNAGVLLDLGKITTVVTIYDDSLISRYGIGITGSSKDGDVDFTCTESPYSGSACIKWTPSQGGDYLKITFDEYIDFSDAEARGYNLEFRMKEETTNWLNNQYFYFYLIESAKNPDNAEYLYRLNAILDFNEKKNESGSEPGYWHVFSLPLDQFWGPNTNAITGVKVDFGSKTSKDSSSNSKWLPDMKYLNEFTIYYRQNVASTIYIDDIKICKQSIMYNYR